MADKADASPTKLGGAILRTAVSVLTLSLSACATRQAILVNDRGEEITCETRGYGIIASLAAVSQQDDCVKDAEKRGYRLKTGSE